ncbi:aminotransferase class IV [Marinilabiliaceae bacterium JC017]|nr:aminotransferase class IV [Marinilabiliaceae bacterium JC017]
MQTGTFYIFDTDIKPVSDLANENLSPEVDIYEVIRVQNQVPLFLENHLERLKRSFQVAGKPIWLSLEEISSRINTLIQQNQIANGNIKLDFLFYKTSTKHFIAYFVPAKYPKSEDYTKGIVCNLFHAERPNPTAKIYNPKLRGTTNNIIENQHVYETLLVDHNNLITEGSRSNVFFIIDNQLYTAPDELVLNGVIRKKVIELTKKLNIPLNYTSLPETDIKKVQAAFITGTSPRILPIRQINHLTLDAIHPVMQQLMEGLNQLINNYIDNNRNTTN